MFLKEELDETFKNLERENKAKWINFDSTIITVIIVWASILIALAVRD